MSDEWWPWIEHDGKGCPVAVGTIIHLHWRFLDGDESNHIGILTERMASSLIWGPTLAFDFLRYRIRKPRGMIILQELIENLPAPVRESEDA